MIDRRTLFRLAIAAGITTPAALMDRHGDAATAAEDLYYDIEEKLNVRWMNDLTAEHFTTYETALGALEAATGLDADNDQMRELADATFTLAMTSFDAGIQIGAALEALRQATTTYSGAPA